MAKIFLDANIYIDLIEGRQNDNLETLRGHLLFISPLSIHILIYVYKYKIPNEPLAAFNRQFSLISLDSSLSGKALLGPTDDYEDNIQLHSSAASDCDYFLTSDRDLLKMRFFGKTQIVSSL